MTGYQSKELRYGAPLRVEDVKAAADGSWEVSGYASVFGVVDLGNDVVHRGAFRDSLASHPKVRFLYSHNPGDVLGAPISLKEDEKGLHGRFRISKTRLGQDVHTLLKDGALDSFSIGYIPREFDFDEDTGTRHLKEIELLEISLVSMPMLPQALVTGVKAADYGRLRLDAVLAEFDEHRTAALAAAKALAGRRRSEGRKLSDRVVALLERLRQGSLDDADALLALLTEPPPEPGVPGEAKATEHEAEAGADAEQPAPDTDVADTPVAVRTAGLVEAHLRRARLKALARKYADVALPPDDPVFHLARLAVPPSVLEESPTR